MTPDPAGQFFHPYSYGGDPINGTDPDGRLFWIDDAVVAVIGGGINYVSGGLNNGDWFNGQAAFNVWNGASSSVAGYNVSFVTTAATGGCFVCGYAAGSLAGSAISSLNNNVDNYASGGSIGNNSWSLAAGPASYTFGSGEGSGFNMASFQNDWSAKGIWNNSLTALNYAGAASPAVGTYGYYSRGSLGFQNPFSQSSQWSLANSQGNLSLDNFNQQSGLSFQAAKDNINTKCKTAHTRWFFRCKRQHSTKKIA